MKKKQEKKTGKHPGGRPPKYNKYMPLIAELAIRNGFTIEQAAEKIGIAASTIYKWQKDHPEFLEAIGNGRAEPIGILKNSLYQSATGYDAYEEKEYYAVQKDEDGNEIKVLKAVEKYKKHIPPNSTSLKFSLCNLDSEHFRLKQEITIKDETIVIKRIKPGEEEE